MHIISGIHKNRTLLSPKGLKTRPTSGRLREALFNICQTYIDDCRFLDLFAGSGAMGLEAISRGAKSATFVDNSKESIRCIQSNIGAIKEEKKTDVIYGNVYDAVAKLAKQGRHYDIIYADPPYDIKSETAEGSISYSLRVLKVIDEMLGTEASLLAPGGTLFLEDAAGALPENEPLQHLTLKSARRMGRSALHCYKVKKTE